MAGGLARRAAWSAAVTSRAAGLRPTCRESLAAGRVDGDVVDPRPIADKRPSTASGDIPDLQGPRGADDVARRSALHRARPRWARNTVCIALDLTVSLSRPSSSSVISRLTATCTSSGRRSSLSPPLHLRRPALGRGAARARALRPRLLPRRSLPLGASPRSADDAQPRDESRRDDAARVRRSTTAATLSCASTGRRRAGRRRPCPLSLRCEQSSHGRAGGE